MRRSRKILTLLLAPVAFVALLYVFRFQVMRASAEFLVVRDTLERADVIFLLNGDLVTRPAYAAKLFQQGWAHKIVIARHADTPGVEYGAYANVTDTNAKMLEKLGIPHDSIEQVRWKDGVEHTVDEAHALLWYTQQHPIRTVLLVTSDLHSRRSRFIFRKTLRDTPVRILVAPVADLKYGAHNWWEMEDGVIGFQNEYIKLLYYYLRY